MCRARADRLPSIPRSARRQTRTLNLSLPCLKTALLSLLRQRIVNSRARSCVVVSPPYKNAGRGARLKLRTPTGLNSADKSPKNGMQVWLVQNRQNYTKQLNYLPIGTSYKHSTKTGSSPSSTFEGKGGGEETPCRTPPPPFCKPV